MVDISRHRSDTFADSPVRYQSVGVEGGDRESSEDVANGVSNSSADLSEKTGYLRFPISAMLIFVVQNYSPFPKLYRFRTVPVSKTDCPGAHYHINYLLTAG